MKPWKSFTNIRNSRPEANQLSGFYIIGTLVVSGLKDSAYENFVKLYLEKYRR